jgi:hypothetical protein
MVAVSVDLCGDHGGLFTEVRGETVWKFGMGSEWGS